MGFYLKFCKLPRVKRSSNQFTNNCKQPWRWRHSILFKRRNKKSTKEHCPLPTSIKSWRHRQSSPNKPNNENPNQRKKLRQGLNGCREENHEFVHVHTMRYILSIPIIHSAEVLESHHKNWISKYWIIAPKGNSRADSCKPFCQMINTNLSIRYGSKSGDLI